MGYVLPVSMYQYEDYMIRTNTLNKFRSGISVERISEIKKYKNDLPPFVQKQSKSVAFLEGKGIHVDEYV